MDRARIDWSQHFQVPDEMPRPEDLRTSIPIFLTRVMAEMTPHRMDEATILQRARTGLATSDAQRLYFVDLFDERAAYPARLTSTLVGSIAYGVADLAGKAYFTLTHIHSDAATLNNDLVHGLNRMITYERLDPGSDARERRGHLEDAAGALGKPLVHRALGQLANGLAAMSPPFIDENAWRPQTHPY